jgi:hypothetical protein
MKTTLFPPRMGKAEEFAHLAVALIQNPMMNGTGTLSLPYDGVTDTESSKFEVVRIDGGSRMAKF